MPDPGFVNLLVVALVAFLAPIGVAMLPVLRIPSVVVEILAGVALGPSVLGLVEADLAVQVLAFVGLAFLLFVVGLELDVRRLRGRVLRLAAAGYAVTLMLGVAAGLGAVDRDPTSHPQFRTKLEAIGYGFLVPVFFVSSGIRLDVAGLLGDPAALLITPLFVLALLVVRGVPALLLRHELTRRETATAGLLQATSLPFLVTTAMIGVETGLLSGVTAASLVAAGIVSVLVFPATALTLLRPRGRDTVSPGPRVLPA